MTRRDGFLALTTGLSVALFSGCASHGGILGRVAATTDGAAVQAQGSIAVAQAGPQSAAPPARPPMISAIGDLPASKDPYPPPLLQAKSQPPIQQVDHSIGSSDLPQQPRITPPQPTTAGPVPSAESAKPTEPAAAEPPVVAALHCLIDKHPADAVELLKNLDKSNQELLIRLLPLVVRLGEINLERAKPEEVAIVLDLFEGAAIGLRPHAALVLDKVCFCGRIGKFGDFDQLPAGYQFHPGELVQLYAELRNFASDQHNCIFETRLASEVRLVRVCKGKEDLIWVNGFHDRERPDRSQTLRHDYFNNYRFCIPENIQPGEYRLYLKVVDVTTGRSTERPLALPITTRP